MKIKKLEEKFDSKPKEYKQNTDYGDILKDDKFKQDVQIKVKDNLERFELLNYLSKHEKGILVNEFGNVVLEKEGQTGKIGFTHDEIQKFRGAYFSHNHPQNNTFLSGIVGNGGDVKIFYEYDMRSIRAKGYDGDIHEIEVINYIEKPDRLKFDSIEEYNLINNQYQNQHKNVGNFMRGYQNAISVGAQKANELYNNLPKEEVKSGKYIFKMPVGWTTYRKGASPRDRMNYPEFAKVIQNEIIEFSKGAEKNYGVRSTITKKADR